MTHALRILARLLQSDDRSDGHFVVVRTTASILVPATSQLFMRSIASLRASWRSAFARPLSRVLGEDLFDAFGAQRSRLRGQLSHHDDDIAFALKKFGDCLTLELP